MELKELRLFVAAAERGGFAQAAKELYTSRSTVSRAVSQLEKKLGKELFCRGANHTLGLTAAGELLLREGKALLSAADELMERVSQTQQ